MKFIQSKKLNKGYGILELVFYVAIFAITALLVINSILTMVSSFKETKANNNLIQSSKILERISREIRSSESAAINGSSVSLTNQDGVVTTFTLNNDDISLYESGNLVGVLNPANISVISLTFTNIVFVRNGSTYVAGDVVPLNSDAVKVALTLEVNSFGVIKSKTFYTTVVLRESY